MDNGEKIKKLLFDGSIRADALQIYIVQFLTLGSGLFISVIVARTLGPANKGIVDLFNLVNSFILELGFLGFGSGLLYQLANRRRPVAEVHGTALAFSLIIGLFTAALGVIGLRIWKLIFPGLNEWILLSAFFIAPFTYYKLAWQSIITGINQAVSSYKLSLIISTLSLVSIVILWTFDLLNVSNVIRIGIVFIVFGAGLCFWILFKQNRKIKASLSLLSDSMKYGLIIYIGNVANILHFKIDQIMINYWLGTKAVGIYAVSVNWAEMLFVLDSAIISAALYKISSANQIDSFLLTKKLSTAQLFISGGSGLLLAMLAHPLVRFLYGNAYAESALPLILLIPGIVAWSTSKIISGFLSYNLGHASYVTKIAISGTLLNIFLNYVFFTRTSAGIVGASIASSISYVMVAILIANKAKSTTKAASYD